MKLVIVIELADETPAFDLLLIEEEMREEVDSFLAEAATETWRKPGTETTTEVVQHGDMKIVIA